MTSLSIRTMSCLDAADVGLDLLQRARRLVAVEVAVEVDLVADEADLAVLRVALATCRSRRRARAAGPRGRRNPRLLSASGTLSVSRSSGSGSGSPSLSRQIAAVSSRSDSADRIALRAGAGSLNAAFFAALSSMRSNSLAILDERRRQARAAACGSPPAARGLRPAPCTPAAPFFFDCAESLETLLLLHPGDALRARLEIQPQRTLDGDLAETEMRGRIDAADDRPPPPCRPF